MRAVLRLLVVLAALAAAPVVAEERIALVLGNSTYSSVSTLDNPSNDARLIGETLERLGFQVTLLIDANQRDMKRGIAQFGRDLRNAGTDATGLFYYAGHGVQSFGSNYLLPVDVSVSDAADLDLEAVEAQSVLRQMFSARNKTNIVILDACRNNPFSDIPAFNDNGLAEMQAPTGTFLAYATAPGEVALDGVENNSPFTRAVAKNMTMPGLPIEQMFKQVRIEVLRDTGGLQTPWDASSLTSDFAFVAATPKSARDLEAEQFWNSVKASRDPVQIMLFLRGYGDSALADEARALLSDVMEKELAGNAATGTQSPQTGPSDAEKNLFAQAEANPTESSFRAYLDAYPDGAFAVQAERQLAVLRDQGSDEAAGSGDTALADSGHDEQEVAGAVTYFSPIRSEIAEIDGLPIAELIGATPLFPPVEGLPESYWKDQTCANCHDWTRERICTQANAYLSLNMQRSLTKAHPFGGAMKRHLKAWAAGGCS